MATSSHWVSFFIQQCACVERFVSKYEMHLVLHSTSLVLSRPFQALQVKIGALSFEC